MSSYPHDLSLSLFRCFILKKYVVFLIAVYDPNLQPIPSYCILVGINVMIMPR